MKRIATFAILAVATMIMAGSALAQSQGVRANIPFSFTVNNSLLPAGAYTIKSDLSLSRVLHLANDAKRVHIMVMPTTDPSGWGGPGTLVFRRYGDQYFLREIHSKLSSKVIQFPITGAEKRARAEAEDARLDLYKNVTIALDATGPIQ